MRLHEFAQLRPYSVATRLRTDKTMVYTRIWADSLPHARRIADNLFGKGNVVTVILASQLSETGKAGATTDAKDKQIKAIKQQTKQVNQQAKLTKAQKSLRAAQNKLRTAQATTAVSAIGQQQ